MRMQKIFLILLLTSAFFCSKGQSTWTIPQNLATAKNYVTVPGGFYAPNGIVMGRYADLTAANTSNSVYYEGALVFIGGDLYQRISGTWTLIAKGTVTNFSAGDLTPLFTTAEATTTTTPALTFSLSNAGGYTVFGNQSASTGAPVYAKLNVLAINATGTPTGSTFLAGDGSWKPAGAGSVTGVSDLPPLFTTSNPNSTPTFVLTNAGAYSVFGNQTSGSAVPSYGKLNVLGINATGTPGIGNWLNGSGAWMAGTLSQWLNQGNNIYFPTYNVGIGDVTTPANLLTVQGNNQGATVDVTRGLYLLNSTPATVGSINTTTNQQFSPTLTFDGQGWKSNATAGSQSTKWQIFNRILQGTITPISELVFRGNVTGTWNEFFKIRAEDGGGGGATFFNTLAVPGINSSGVVTSSLFGSTYGGSYITATTQTENTFGWTGNINATAGTTTRRGIYLAPTTSGTTGLTLIGFQNTIGDNLNNSTSGSTAVGVSSTINSSAKLQVDATDKGLLIPRLTTSQRNAIASPATGLIIFCTDCTATDGSTGVSQTYSSSTWKNHY